MKGRVIARRAPADSTEALTVAITDATVAMARHRGAGPALDALATAVITLGYVCNSDAAGLATALHALADRLPELLADMHRINAAPANTQEMPS